MLHNNQIRDNIRHSGWLRTALIALLLGLSSPHANAFTAGSNEPIRIQSDRAELDEQKGLSTYTGDVVITQGSSVLESDKVIV